jgi:hypothetical protein
VRWDDRIARIEFALAKIDTMLAAAQAEHDYELLDEIESTLDEVERMMAKMRVLALKSAKPEGRA